MEHGIKKETIVDIARSFLGTKYRHQGRLKNVGVDCAGVMIGCGNESGWSEAVLGTKFQYSAYGRVPVGSDMQAVMDANLTMVEGDCQVGDILLMAFELEPQHIAMLVALDPPYIVHALAQEEFVAEHRLDDYWKSKIRQVYRFTGVV